MPAPDSIRQLVDRFTEHAARYHQSHYNETQARREFIDPFFEALGWDVSNRAGYSETYKDVVHEDALQIEGRSRAPDYAFRIGGQRVFFVEAKKPSVNLREDFTPAFQLRRYAWSAHLSLSILTDFEEFAVYDCRKRPEKNDSAGIGRILFLRYTDYVERWDELVEIFSPEAIRRGRLERYVESKGKRGTQTVDNEFLCEMEDWRKTLAQNLALRNPRISVRELNYAVQMTIDRIIFLRICEDRGIERSGQLQDLLPSAARPAGLYSALCGLFRQADARYNSGLFHFKTEKDSPAAPDDLTLNLVMDDKPLKELISRLYFPSPYEFSVLPVEILGQVYERFLGKVIRLTEGHRAVVEEKPEVRKAGGVYYTPAYIVNYIVKQTGGRRLEDKQPGDVGVGRGDPLRIVDPACGSGSFLLGAYQYLLDWYRAGYAAPTPEKWARGASPRIFQAHGGEWRLTTTERKRILLQHIYGVDLDTQAVEVTKLSLLLKVLEGENAETVGQQMALFQERALPDLGRNIQCGNSLIGPDFYDAQQLGLFGAEEQLRVNAFDWQAAFPAAFARGGFDAVIGNPPYVRQEGLGEFKVYLNSHYRVYHGMADLYAYFIERGFSLLRPDGLFGYIVANKWMRANYGEPLRRWLRQQCIVEITDFGDLPVFEQATTYPCILVLRQAAPGETIAVTQVQSLDFTDLSAYQHEQQYPLLVGSLQDAGWSLARMDAAALLDKLRNAGMPLGDYVRGGIFYGIKTGLNAAFVIDLETRERLIAEDPRSVEMIVPFLLGREIKRYQTPANQQYLILFPKGWTRAQSKNAANAWNWLKRNYPAIANHLEPFAQAAEKRYDKGEYWWELRTCDYYAEFQKPKIFIPAIVQNASYAYDTNGIYSNDKTSIIPTDDLYLVGILNSKVSDFVVHKIASTKQGGYYEYKPMYVSQIPIRVIDFNNPVDAQRHARMLELVEQMLGLHAQNPHTPGERSVRQRQIETVDRQIDALVYQLYNLTPEEIKIIESS